MKSKSFTQTLCTLYLAVLFIVYPLFQHDHYYNMGDNKYYFYLISTVIFLILLAISVLTDPARYYKSKTKNKKSKGKNKATAVVNEKLTFKQKVVQLKDKFMAWFGPKSIVEKFVWAYLLFAIISFIFGIDKYTGFWGDEGWNMGLLVQCLMIACFFVYAKVWEPDMKPFYFSMIGSSVVMFLGIIMRFGIDPLGNYEGLDQMYINMFISTIGQSSWYSAYICTVIPIGIGLFFVSDKKLIRIISGLYSILSFMALAIADSDSIYLSIIGMLMILFWVAFSKEKYMVRFFEITTLLLGSFALMESIKILFGEYYNAETDVTSIKMGNLSLYCLVLSISLSIMIALKILNTKEVLTYIYRKQKILIFIRTVLYVLIVLVITLAIVYLILNTMGMFGVTSDMIPERGDIRFFDYHWGNNRGVSWIVCWELFMDYNFWRKLIGIGPDSLSVAINYADKYRHIIEVIHGDNLVLSCAHNEFYNHIVVYGLLGGFSYVGIYVSGIVNYMKSFVKTPIVLIAAMCIASYIGHNFFCYQTVTCTPFILIIMGLTVSLTKKEIL